MYRIYTRNKSVELMAKAKNSFCLVWIYKATTDKHFKGATITIDIPFQVYSVFGFYQKNKLFSSIYLYFALFPFPLTFCSHPNKVNSMVLNTSSCNFLENIRANRTKWRSKHYNERDNKCERIISRWDNVKQLT